MLRYFLLLLGFFVCFHVYSSEKSGGKNQDYGSDLNKAIFRLNCHPGDRLAMRKIQKTYSEAISYYQWEIKQLHVSDDSLKWNKTLDLMQKTNDLSDEILFNSEANKIICDPNYYTIEIDSVTPKAVAEVYDLGVKSLARNTKQKAKEAYFHFTRAGKLNPKYKDVGRKILEARDKATVNVIVNRVSAYADYKNLFTEKFYQTVFYKLWTNFLNDQFIKIYSVSDAANRKLDMAAWNVSISFVKFEINSTSTFENIQSVYTSGVAEIKIFSANGNKDILDTRIPAQYVWSNYSPGNQLNLQDLFDSFSLSVSDQVVELLTDNLNKFYPEAKVVP